MVDWCLVFYSFCFIVSHRGGILAIKILAEFLSFSFFYWSHWFRDVVKPGFSLLTYLLLPTGWSWLSILPQNWQVTICLFMPNRFKLYRTTKILNFLLFYVYQLQVWCQLPLQPSWPAWYVYNAEIHYFWFQMHIWCILIQMLI